MKTFFNNYEQHRRILYPQTASSVIRDKENPLTRASGKLAIAMLVFAGLAAMPMTANAQYLEQFSTPNKGYLLSNIDDITGINWSLSAWNAANRDASDYFSTTASEVLECIDLDQEVYWESPLINTTAAPVVSLKMNLTWAEFDTDAIANNCSTDWIKVQYSVNGGAYTMVPNVAGGNACATVAYAYQNPAPVPGISGSILINHGGITGGGNLRIRVIVFTNVNAEKVTIDNVNVPEAGVTVGCAPPVLSTVLTQVGCSNPNSGAIDLSVSAGTPPYTYDWSNNGSQNPDTDPQDLNGLPVGPYTVTVTDAASCSATTSVNITNAPALALSTQVLNTNCAGTIDGEIDLIVSGGVPGYTYDWSNNGAQNPDTDQQDLIGVGTGNYSVTITDASGCTGTTSAMVGTLPATPYLEQFNIANKGYLAGYVDDFSAVNWTMSSWAPAPPAAFGRETGDYFKTGSGVLTGIDFDQEICWTSPLISLNTGTQFSVGLTWTNFDNEDYINVKYSINGGAYLTLPNALGNGAAGTIQYPFPTLDQSSNATVTKTGLSGSTIQIQVCGNFNNETITVDNVSVPNSTTYCPTPEISLTPTNVTCVGGSSGNNGIIQVTAGSGTPGYSVSWSGPSSGNPAGTEIASSGGSYNITNLAAGTYLVTVTDANGITATASETLTLTPTFTIGNQVYNDVNRNGIFDGGDMGINGVTLNLYQDVNSNNMLDAGDGAAVAMATTALLSGQNGRYAFSGLCPSTYIVQVAPSNFNMGGALYNMGAPFVSSPLSGAGDPDVDLDDDDDNGDAVSGFGVATAAFTISGDNNNIDFGFKTPTIIYIDNATQDEGTGGSTSPFSIVVTRSNIADNFTLSANTMPGTASNSSDYTALVNQPIAFTAGGATTGIVTVYVNHDNMVEANETFEVVISGAPPDAIITDNTGVVTITNDDAATVTLSANTSQNEGNSGSANYTFTATLNNPVQGGFTIAYTTSNNSATAGSDYTDNDGSLTFIGNAGEEQFIQVPILGDMVVELDETFTVALGAITGAPAGVTAGASLMGTITNDDAATVTISNVSMNEGNAGDANFVFTVTLNGEVDAAVGMNYATVDGSATLANNDYDNTSGALTPFTANGGTSQTRMVTVPVNGDLTFESNETFLLRLSSLSAGGRNVSFSPGGATLDGTGTILNDDVPPLIINEVDADQTGIDAAEFVEIYDGGVGNTNLNGLVLVFYNGSNDQSYRSIDLDGFTTDALGYFLAGNPGVPGVGVTFPNDNLQNGQDAVALYIGNATDFPANTPVTTTNLLDAIVYDTADPDDPGLLVLLNAGQPQIDENGGGSSTCHSMQRIPNGSGGLRNTNTYQALPPTPKAANFAPEVTISVSPASVMEDGPTNLTYTIARTGNAECDLSVSFTVGGTATSGTDYPAIAASPITIPAGSATTTIVVNPNTDNTVEPDETIIITLTDGALYDLGTSLMATGTITNDDNTTLTLSQPAGASQNEGNAGPTLFTYRITLSNPVQGGFRVNYATNNGTATTADSDYSDNDNFLDFTGTTGEFHEFTVNVTGDTKVEADETIQTEMVSLSLISVNPANVVFSGSPFTSTILNDDAATLTITPVSQDEGTGGTTDYNFEVTLNPAVQDGFGLNFVVNDGTATDADDFDVITASPLAFAGTPGESHNIVVRVDADNKVEAHEIFTVQLVSLSLVSVDPFDVTFSGSPATGTITNDDAATVTLSGGLLLLNEGNTGTTPFMFTATLNNPVQGGFHLAYTTDDGTATTADNDYVNNDGTLMFLGNANEPKNITVLVNGDFIVENDELFTVSLGAFSNSTPVQLAALSTLGSPQTGGIKNDEIDWSDAPTSAQTGFANDYPTTMANNGARHTTTLGIRLGATIDGELDGQPNGTATGDGADEDGVTLPGALVVGTTATIVVNASAANSKLDAWVDFNRDGIWNNDASERVFAATTLAAGNNTLTFAVPPGASLGVSYARFRVSGSGGLPPTGIASTGEVEDYAVNIANTQFSINDPVAITEGNMGTTDLIFTVTRSNTSNACSVEYSFTGGAATLGDGDYTVVTPSPISFTAGGSPTASIIVRVNGDTKVELNETVEISLSNPVNGSILDGLGVGTINNDDAATLSITNPTMTEGDAGTQNMTFDLSLTNPSDANVVVNFATMNGSATTTDLDYQSAGGSHTFTPGQTSKQVVVLINGDCNIETNEQLTVQLSGLNANSRNVTLSGGGSTLSGTGTINNNDAAPVITCPGPITISCDASQLPANTGMATASDNCSPQPTLGYTDATTPGSCVGNYTIARTWKATDNTGDMSTCIQTITVVDNTPPVPVCRTATVTLNGAGMYSLTAADVLNLGASTDNCSDVSVVSFNPNLLTCNQLGQTVPVVVVVEDDCRNTAQCTAQITVVQSTALPGGWISGNIGTNANGNATYQPCTNGGTYTLSAQGYTTNITDVQHVVYQTLCNNAEIIAHIGSLAPSGGFAGVQMRESTSQGSKKFTLKTQFSNSLRREIRTMTFGATNTLQSVVPPFHTWLRLVRS
ncbi:MAG: hypothetical protein JNK77_18225, partial [Saprospiraceae bacterium]|nr:hypothetical protein [Saprospiraceae bacterium]